MRSSLPTWVSRSAHGICCSSSPAPAGKHDACARYGQRNRCHDRCSDRSQSSRCQTTRARDAFGNASTKLYSCGQTARDQLVPTKTAWWSQTGSNRRPPACKAGALPAELWPPQEGKTGDGRQTGRVSLLSVARILPSELVGLDRLERSTSPLSGVRSNHLSYRPESLDAQG